LLAGAFLWVFTDEAVLRTDKEGSVFDGSGNNAPDGIMGPHREKEGSFYTVKEIWSPVQVEPVTVNRQWNGKLFLKNKFIYTNLKECGFSWKTLKTPIGSTKEEITGSGIIASPAAKSGETVEVTIDFRDALIEADFFQLKAIDREGYELYTWSWPVIQPEEKAAEFVKLLSSKQTEIKTIESADVVTVSANGIEVSFNKKNGTIQNVKNKKGAISFSGGPIPVGVETEVEETSWEINVDGNFEFKISNNGYPREVTWIVNKNGLLYLEASQLQRGLKDIDFVGITFNYPEDKCRSVSWMGRGPYRVWKNRLKGSNIGVWEKEYNNTITGESFNELIYPEFKGYHGNLYWAKLETSESPITIISETPNLYFQLFTPAKPKQVRGGVYPPFPDGDLSFLYEIPAIGTKFQQADVMGPTGQKGMFKSHRGDENYPIKLWFDFRVEQ